MKAKVEEYASVELKSDLVNNLSDKEKELVRIFFQVGKITDDLFWKQTFGDKSKLDTITDSYAKEFAMIHYGAWNRLDNNKPFLAGYGEKPDVCNYYPLDITEAEFNAFEDENKDSWYTVIRRNEDGSPKSVWYHEAYAPEIEILDAGKKNLNEIGEVMNTYNPQIQISAESETKRSIFREKDKTKRSKKESAQHSKSRNKSFVMTSVSAL